uniref:Protein FAM136A n=1 Tax=Leersia perrieri TaxID=77586 RepID=A0A0D9XQY0_9ORYZ
MGKEKTRARLQIGGLRRGDLMEGSMEERVVTERIRRKLEEVNSAVQTHLAGVQDHVNFTMQQAYFKCAYECFDRRRSQEGINNCVENCSVPVLSANNVVETEMAKFQAVRQPKATPDCLSTIAERLNRSMMVCQDKFEAAKLQKMKTHATEELESCVNRSIDDSIRVLPHLVDQIKSSLHMN